MFIDVGVNLIKDVPAGDNVLIHKDDWDKVVELNDKLRDRIAALEAENATLRRALEPFVGKRRKEDDGCLYCGWGLRNHETQCSNPRCSLTVRAAKALRGEV